jgi:WD40 repeat protein
MKHNNKKNSSTLIKILSLVLALSFPIPSVLAQVNPGQSEKPRIELGIKVPQNPETITEEEETLFQLAPLKTFPAEPAAYKTSCTKNYCAFSLKNGKVIVYDLKGFFPVLDKQFSDKPIYGIDFHPFKNTICFGDRTGNITIYDLNKDRIIHTIHSHDKKPVSSVKFSPDGTLLAASYLGKTEISLYTTRNYKLYQTIHAHEKDIYSVSFSSDSDSLAAGSGDKKISITKIGKENPDQILINHNFLVMSTDFSQNGGFLATGGADAVLFIWEKRQDSFLKTPYFTWVHKDWVNTVKFFKHYLLTGSKDNIIRIFDFRRKTIVGNFETPGPILHLDITPDGKYLSVASQNMIIYDFEELLANLKEIQPEKTVQTIQGRIISAPDDKEITFRDIEGKSYSLTGSHTQKITKLYKNLGRDNLLTLKGKPSDRHYIACTHQYEYADQDSQKTVATQCIKYIYFDVLEILKAEKSQREIAPALRETLAEKEMSSAAMGQDELSKTLKITGQATGEITFVNLKSPIKTLEVTEKKGSSLIFILDTETKITRKKLQEEEPVSLSPSSLETGQKVTVVYQRNREKNKAVFITVLH